MQCILRYSGGKFAIASTLVAARALLVEEYREPFVGAGSVFFAMREQGYAATYWINDVDPKISGFWTIVRDQVDALTDMLFKLLAEHGNTEKLFWLAEAMMESENAVEAAAGLWNVNRLAYSGMIKKGGFNRAYMEQGRGVKTHFITHLRRASHHLQDVRITNLDYKDVVVEPGQDVMIFADPPYDEKGKEQYEFGEIDLDEFGEVVAASPHNILITIDDSRANIERLSGFTIRRRTHQANMSNEGKTTELVAMNYTPPNPLVLGQIGEFIGRPADNENSPQAVNRSIVKAGKVSQKAPKGRVA